MNNLIINKYNNSLKIESIHLSKVLGYNSSSINDWCNTLRLSDEICDRLFKEVLKRSISDDFNESILFILTRTIQKCFK